MLLPPQYAFLLKEPGPRILQEALKLFGTKEQIGPGSNPTLLMWADTLGDKLGTAYAKWADTFYSDDLIPWCGLFIAYVVDKANDAKRPERAPITKYLSAGEWAHWGIGVDKAELGDILVFVRPGGGHVGIYVGEDQFSYHVLGGNQADSVCIVPIAKSRCTAIRRPPYLNKPANVRSIRISQTTGIPVSTNEA